MAQSLCVGEILMQQFRGFVKARTDLGGKAITNAGMQIVSFSISRDLLTSATSNFTFLQAPQALSEGDVLGVYGENGQIIYNGVITSISNDIQCVQMAGLFDDDYMNRTFESTNTIESDVKTLLYNATVGNEDKLLSNEFKPFVYSTSTNTEGKLLQGEDYTTPNLQERIYGIYDTYDVIVDIKVPFEEVQPTITIGKNTDVAIKLGSNAISVLSIIPTTTASETNKLVIYSTEKEADGVTTPPQHRATYYLTPNGITDNALDLSRMAVVKTKYVFSDEDLATIKNGNLSNKLYNHEITASLALNGSLYDFWSWNLGQKFNIFDGTSFYETILTGYTLNFQDGSMPSVTLKFGKVRYNLESKLFRLFKNSSI